jgi:hypothetical protein
MNQQSLVPMKSPDNHGVGLMRLQRKCACEESGATCARCTNTKSGLQRKLAIGASNDPLEKEADRVADQVMAAPGHSAVHAIPPRIQRYVGKATEGTDSAPVSVELVIARSGRPLDPTLRRDMEQRFGHDFSQVRVHSGADAEQSVQDVNANAYTVGNNIVFGTGRFAPFSHEGRRLIAHELTHVVQQSGADGIRTDLGNVKRGLFQFPLQQQVTAGPFLVRRAPGDGEPSPPVVLLPSKSENQSRLAELMADWVPSPEKQRQTTISRAAAIELKTGRRVYLIAIAGEGAALPLNHSLLRPDEVSVPYAGGHAEIQTMHFAAKEGYKILPGALEPSRAFCTNCAFWARHGGLTPSDAKVRVGQHEKPLAEVPDSELAKHAGSKKIPGWRGELTEKGKAKQKAKQSKTPATQVRISEQNAAKPSVVKEAAVNGDEPRVRVGEQSPAANPSSPQVKQSIVDGRIVNTEDIIGVIGNEESPTSGNLEQAKPTAKKYLNVPETRTQPPPTTGSSPITAKPTPQAGTPAQPALKRATAASPGGSPTTVASAAATADISSSGSSSAKTSSNAVTPASIPAAKGTTATPAQQAVPQPSSPVGTAGTGTAAAKAPVDATPPRLTGTQGQRVYGGAQPASKALAPTQAQQQHADAVQQRAAGVVMMLNLTRARLEDISDDDERDKAEIWLVQNRPVIYQTLFEHPGAAMVVQFHFERVDGRLKYRGATTDMAADGQPPQPAKEDSYDIAGTGVKLFFPPVRKAPQPAPKQDASQLSATVKPRLVQSAEELIGRLPNGANSLASYYTLQDARGAGIMGPFRMRLGMTDVEVTVTALDEAIQAYRVRLERSLGDRHQRLKDSIAQSQKNLEAAMTSHGNFVTKWWYRKRIALLDPHVMDKPREHEAAALDSLARGDFRAATTSLMAGEELVTLAEERIHQFYEGVDRIEEQEI